MYKELKKLNLVEPMDIPNKLEKLPQFKKKFSNENILNEYSFIILGKPGPTGKSNLCNLLKNKKYNAIELSEGVLQYVRYNDKENHYLVDEFSKIIVIILNKDIRDLITEISNQRKREDLASFCSW